MSISTASVISTLPCWSTAALMSERYRLHLVTLRHQRHWIFTLMHSLRRRQKRVKQSPPHLTSERKKHRWNLVLIWCLFIWKHAEIWWNIWKRKAQKTLILRSFWQYLITSKNASNGFESRFPLHCKRVSNLVDDRFETLLFYYKNWVWCLFGAYDSKNTTQIKMFRIILLWQSIAGANRWPLHCQWD